MEYFYIAEVAMPAFRRAAEQAGRDPDGLEVTALVTCCVADDPAGQPEWMKGL